MKKMLIYSYLISMLLTLFSCSEKPSSGIIPDNLGDLGPVTGVFKDDSGKPMAGIVVSDGFTVVTTDMDGKYTIPTRNANACYVYYSIPADVKIESGSNGRPSFYQKLSSDKTVYDFTLKKQAVEKDFRLIAIGDPQVRVSTDGIGRFSREIAPDVKKYVSDHKDMPAYAVVMGDMVHNEWDIFSDIFDEMTYDKTGTHCFMVIGNHDHEFNGTDPLSDIKAQRKYELKAGPVNYSFDRGDCHILVLDNIVHQGKTESSFSLGFTDTIMDWIKKDLSHVSKDKQVVLCIHGLLSACSEKFNKNEFMELVKDYADFRVIVGHNHSVQRLNSEINGFAFEEDVVGSANGVDWMGTICGDGAPIGYGIYTFSGKELTNYVHKGAHHDESFQIRIYHPQDWTSVQGNGQTTGNVTFKNNITGTDKVLMNIWNFREDWTLDIYEDGIKVADRKSVERSNTYYDMWAVYYFYSIMDRASYSYCQRRNHMFLYQMQNPKAKFKIVATDCYGNIFEQDEFTGPGKEDYPSIPGK